MPLRVLHMLVTHSWLLRTLSLQLIFSTQPLRARPAATSSSAWSSPPTRSSWFVLCSSWLPSSCSDILFFHVFFAFENHSSYSRFSAQDIRCQGCANITTVFSHAQTVVVCSGCAQVLCTPSGGKAKLSEGTPAHASARLSSLLPLCIYRSPSLLSFPTLQSSFFDVLMLARVPCRLRFPQEEVLRPSSLSSMRLMQKNA